MNLCFRIFTFTILIFFTPSSVYSKEIAIKQQWFNGIESGKCSVLQPNSDFVKKNLVQNGKVQRRIALVIGNSNYLLKDWFLPNPKNDAAAISNFLQTLGFEVYVVIDGSAQVISDCADRATQKNSELSLLYYSGHGVQFEYNNYIVATDIIKVDKSLKGLVSLDKLTEIFGKTSKSLLVFLDACRNNPLPITGRVGLAPEKFVLRSMKGISAERSQSKTNSKSLDSALNSEELFIVFSTSPNATASDGAGDFSPFTEAFLKNVFHTGWPIQKVIAAVSKEVGEKTNWSQTPWSRSSLTNQIFLNGSVDPISTIKASELKAKEANDLLAIGKRKEAIAKALEGLPKNFDREDIKNYNKAYVSLFKAVRSRSLQLPILDNFYIAYSHDGSRVATMPVYSGYGNDKSKETFKLWNTLNGSLITELLPLKKSGTITGSHGKPGFSRDGRFVIAMDMSTARPVIWDANNGKKIKELNKALGYTNGSVPHIELSSSGKYALISNYTGLVTIYDVQSGKIIWTVKVEDHPIDIENSIYTRASIASSISIDEKIVIFATHKTLTFNENDIKNRHAWKLTIEAYHLETKKKLWSKSTDLNSEIIGHSLTFSDDNKYVGIATKKSIRLFKLQTGKLDTINKSVLFSPGFSISPNGKNIAYISKDLVSMNFIDTTTQKIVSLPYNRRAYRDIVFTLEGKDLSFLVFKNAGDVWRRGVEGPALYKKAVSELKEDNIQVVENNRVKFR
jgi:uncharacterized caspase-like protein